MGGAWNCLVKMLLEHNCTSPAQWSKNAFTVKEKLSTHPGLDGQVITFRHKAFY